MSKKIQIHGVQYPEEYPKYKKNVSGYQDSTLLYTSLLNMGRYKFLIYPRKDKIQADGRCSLYARVSINQERSQVSLNVPVFPDLWDAKRQMLKGKDKYATMVNDLVEATKHSLYELSRRLILEDRMVNAKMFMDIWQRKDQKPESFYKWMRKTLDNQWDQDLISFNTYRGRDLVCRLIAEHCEDLDFESVNLEWIYEFRNFLKQKMKKGKSLVANGDNTVNKYLKIVKTYIGLAMREFPGKIARNPFDDYKLVFRHEEKQPLTAAQVKMLWELYHNNTSDLDRQVLHAFLFQIHTGLRISDLRSLHSTDIKRIPYNGKDVLVIQKLPQKTARYGKLLNVPVPNIFAKYVSTRSGLIFELPSEPRYNMALKKIGMFIGAEQSLASHIARHTFATLNMHMGENPIVTMNLLGHSSLNTTRIYTHHILQQHVDAIEKLSELIENG